MAEVIEDLSEDEAYLFAILQDESGIDIAEFIMPDEERVDGCFRAWPYQWAWFRCLDPLQIDQCGRSVGKSLSIQLRALAFPFVHPGQEMIITAPEGNHLDAVTDNVESIFYQSRLMKEMLVAGRTGIKHRPFHVNFKNGSRIMGRIPQRDGKGVKGCVTEGTLVLTRSGYVPVEEVSVGDEVLTHRGRYMPVMEIREDINDCYEVKGQSSFPLTVSCDHRFLGAENQATPKQRKNLDALAFHDVEYLIEDNVYWATPRSFPSLPVPEFEYTNGNDTRLDISLDDFWWLVGRYLADGFLSQSSVGTQRRVHWVVHPNDRSKVEKRLASLGVHWNVRQRDHSSADVLEVCSRAWNTWLRSHFGEHCDGKTLPAFVLGLPESYRKAVLDGYLSGDGSYSIERNRFSVGSASRRLVLGVQMLAQSLGFTVNCSFVDPKVSEVMGVSLKNEPRRSWRLQILETGHPVEVDDVLVGKIKSVSPVGERKVYNLIVEEDHSYIAESIVSHNTHPIWLEMDESQDYPEAGWIELFETLKGADGAVWRSHGVTRGVRDKFYDFTNDPDTQWTVHRHVAMERPDWSGEQRERRIRQYGSMNDPDYQRNVLGKHGDAQSPIFVFHRLMACVDDDQESRYNQDEYKHIEITEGYLRQTDQDILDVVTLPEIHTDKWSTFWAGMDVGYCVDEKTQIFTRQGWRFFNELSPGDETLSINPETRRSEWVEVESIYREQFNNLPMVSMQGQSFSSLTTAHHKWLVQGESGTWRWKQTRSLNSKDRVPLTVDRADVPSVSSYSDDFVELVAWFWTEGWWTSRTSAGIAQSERANPGHVERIRSLCKRLFGDPSPAYVEGTRDVRCMWTEDEGRDGYRGFRFRGPLVDSLRAVVDAQKVPSIEFISSLTMEQLGIFIETSVDADGWRTASGARKIEQRNENGILAMEAACALAGLATSTHYDSVRQRYHLSILGSRSVQPIKAAQFPRTGDLAMTIDVVDYSGFIWCPTVKYGNWLARRDGSVYFTGNTNHPSEVVVFAEERVPEDEYKYFKKHKEGGVPESIDITRLKLVLRISLHRIGSPQQRKVIEEIVGHYMPKAYSFDSTGNGLPMFQEVTAEIDKRPHITTVLKGYNFSGNILVDFDKTISLDEWATKEDQIKEAGIKRNAVDYATDKLRYLIDNGRLRLPWDRDLISEFQGQTYKVTKTALDQYGRREYSLGKFHALDAARMAVLGWAQFSIEEFVKDDDQEPVLDIFVSF